MLVFIKCLLLFELGGCDFLCKFFFVLRCWKGKIDVLIDDGVIFVIWGNVEVVVIIMVVLVLMFCVLV